MDSIDDSRAWLKLIFYGAEIKVSSPETLDGRLEPWKKTWSTASQSLQKWYDSMTIGKYGSVDLRGNWLKLISPSVTESPKIRCYHNYGEWPEIRESRTINKVPCLLSLSRVHDDTAVTRIFFVFIAPEVFGAFSRDIATPILLFPEFYSFRLGVFFSWRQYGRQGNATCRAKHCYSCALERELQMSYTVTQLSCNWVRNFNFLITFCVVL